MSASSPGPKSIEECSNCWYKRKGKHQTTKTSDKSTCFPLCKRRFQTFFCKALFVRWTFANHVIKPDWGRYSTVGHLQVVNQLQERANGYNIPISFTFINYEKAFDSIEFEPLFEGLKNQGVDEKFSNIMQNRYSEETSVLRLYKDSEKFKLGRGVRQGEPLSPKLFTPCP